jgi:hypothetical protein
VTAGPSRHADVHARSLRRMAVGGLATLGGAAVLCVAGPATATPATGTEHFSLIQITTIPNSDGYSAIATGVFTAGGTATLGPRSGILRLTGGDVYLTAKPLGVAKTTTNAATCLTTSKQSWSYRFMGGSGAYKRISGTGVFTDTKRQVARFYYHACSPTSNPAAVQSIITWSAPVSLG